MIVFTRNAALRIALAYFIFSLLWILLSDRFIEAISASQETLSALQTLKGGLFVVVTSLGLYGLLRISYRRLADSEARYRSVVEDMPGLLCRFRPGGIIDYVNDAYARAFGQKPEALVDRSFLSLIPEQNRAAVMAAIEALTPESPVLTHEHPVIGANGEIRWQRWTNRLLTDERGSPLAYQSFGMDITAHKQAERALNKSEERYRMAQRLSRMGLWEWDIVTNQVYWSDEALMMWGFLPNEFNGLFGEVVARIHSDDYARWQEDIRACVEDGREHAVEFRIVRPDGQIRWMAVFGDAERNEQGKACRMMGIVLDVTARKQSEQALRDSEAQLDRAQLAGRVGAWAYDLEQRVFNLSKGFMRIYGMNRSNYPAEQMFSFVLPQDRAKLEKAFQQSIHDRIPFDLECHVIRRDNGEKIWVQVCGDLQYDASGRPVAVMGVSHDITERKQAEIALFESEERLRLFIEHAPAALAMFDRQMRYLAFSRRWIADYGLQGDIIGRSHYEVFPEIPARWKAAYQRGLQDEVSQADEDSFRRLDGSVQWLRWAVRPWHANDGAVGGIVIFTEDITERKHTEQELQESRQRFLHALENVPDVVVIYDRDLRIQYINAAARTVTGRPPTDFIGRREEELWPPQVYNAYLPALKKALGEGTQEALEADLTLPDGQMRNLSIACVPLHDEHGRVREVLSITRDLSAYKAVERQIRQINLELEERVRTRTAELSAANERLRDLDRLKSLFIASMSHELRTPLNSIIGFTGMIVSDMAGSISDQQRDYLQRAYQAGKHLLALITDIIDISKIEAGRLAIEYRSFKLEPVVAEALSSVESEVRRKSLELVVDMPNDIAVCTDRKRLLQCLLNLLSNAVKYTECGGVQVTVRGDAAHVEIAVRDSGIGIPESALDQLFQPFVRLDSKLKSQASGTGLGLYLTRKLAREVLGGDVAVSRCAGGGCLFTLRIARQMSQNTYNQQKKRNTP